MVVFCGEVSWDGVSCGGGGVSWAEAGLAREERQRIRVAVSERWKRSLFR